MSISTDHCDGVALKLDISGAILEIGLRVGVILYNVISGHVLLTMFVSFYSQRVQKPLQGALSEVFCTKLCLIHHVKLVFVKKLLFCKSKGGLATTATDS